MTRRTPYLVLTLAVLVLILGPIGTAVFVLGFGYGDSPCVLCWAQRTGMVLVALTGLFVVRFGPRPRYLGMGVLISAAGVYMGIRHSALHVARDVGQGFSLELLGAHTYTWSAFIYWVCLLVMGALLVSSRDGEITRTDRTLRPLEGLAMGLFLVTVAGNVVQAFASTGPPPFMGQSDPIRFSFQPRHWTWSTDEWAPSPVSLRGRWAIEKPDVSGLPTDPAAGPLGQLPPLVVRDERPLALPLDSPPTDLAFDAASRRFLLTTTSGVYVADAALARVERRAIVDTGFSVDLARFSGAAFLGGGDVIALSENKSYVVLRQPTGSVADQALNFRFFLEGADQFEEQMRGRFTTVRARMMYAMAIAADQARQALYTVTVPNARARRLVVSRFDRADMTLAEEFSPGLVGGLRAAGDRRTVDEFYVTGAVVDGRRLYAVSAAYATVLVLDLDTHALIAAYAVPGLRQPAGLALQDDNLVIVTTDGRVITCARPPAV